MPSDPDARIDWCAKRALHWVREHTIRRQGVLWTTLGDYAYPEVSGYYIPTLLEWDEQKLARQYARWLIKIQHSDGAWGGPSAEGEPYCFDVGQVIKGLVAVCPNMPEARSSLEMGCDWLMGQIGEHGKVFTPCADAHEIMDGGRVPDAVHLYVLQGLRDAAKLLNRLDMQEAVHRSLDYYSSADDVADFRTLSHFHAYMLEALWDLGREDLAHKGMEQIIALQRDDGAVQGIPGEGVSWVCSTGLAQYALIWLKMGKREPARRAIEWLCDNQNDSGGFFGAYNGGYYFPDAEISWACKYFLDAVRLLKAS